MKTSTLFCRKILLLSLAVVLSTAGCAVTQNLQMEDSRSGESDMEVRLAEELRTYLLDLSGVLGVSDEEEISPFDLEALAVLLGEEPGLELLGADIPEADRLTLTLRIEDIERIFTDGPHRVEGLIHREVSGRETTITVELDRTRVQQISSLSPVAEQSAVEFLLPPEQMDEDEYVEYLAWAMEEYEDEHPIEDVIRDARIELRVEVPGTLLSVTGGEREGNVAVFYERAAYLLTVREPTRWSFTWRD